MVYVIIIIFTLIISIIWVNLIDNMKNQHPDYKGEDFLNWDGKHDDWDKSHTEGEI